MKKISTLFLIILCICLAVVLASCGEHTHDFGADEGTVITEPTCMYEGKLVRTCECGKTKIEALNKLQHSYSETISFDNAYHYYACTTEKCTSFKELTEHEWVIDASKTVPATCNSIGSETYNCTCGAQKTVNVAQIREHVWDAGVDTAATCIATGVKTYTCTICSETKTEELPLVPHVFDTSYTGNETHHYIACKTAGCEEIQEDSTAEHVWNEGELTLAPTCMTVGEMTYKCTVCENTKTEEIPTLPHAFSDDYRSNATYHYHYCKNEGCTAIDGNNAHDWGDGVVTREPQAALDGVRTYTCAQCGRTKTEAIVYHSYSEWTFDETKHYKKCTVKGHTDIIEEGEHVWDDGVKILDPTPTSYGKIVYSCVCGCQNVRPLIYTEAQASNIVDRAAWKSAFADGKFSNLTFYGVFNTVDNDSFYAGVKLDGNKSLEKIAIQNGYADVYYSVEDGVKYAYTYNSETSAWEKAESSFAYTESFVANLFDAGENFFDFVFVTADGCYEATDVTVGGTDYSIISFVFENGTLVEISAILKTETSIFGNSVKSFEIEIENYGTSSVELPQLPEIPEEI